MGCTRAFHGANITSGSLKTNVLRIHPVTAFVMVMMWCWRAQPSLKYTQRHLTLHCGVIPYLSSVHIFVAEIMSEFKLCLNISIFFIIIVYSASCGPAVYCVWDFLQLGRPLYIGYGLANIGIVSEGRQNQIHNLFTNVSHVH